MKDQLTQKIFAENKANINSIHSLQKYLILLKIINLKELSLEDMAKMMADWILNDFSKILDIKMKELSSLNRKYFNILL